MGNIGLAVERTNCGFIAEDAKICLDTHFPFPPVVNHKHHNLRRDILLSRADQVPGSRPLYCIVGHVEIGRASCRERGEIWGVGGLLTRKEEGIWVTTWSGYSS